MLLLDEPFNSKITVETRLNECVVKLAVLLGYDVAKIIEFNENQSFATIRREYARGEVEYSRNFKNNRIFLKDSKKYILKVMLKKKQMAAYFQDDNSESDCITLIENIKSEIYIPLFLDDSISKVIIGCIYLATFKDKRFDKFEEIIDDEAMEIIRKVYKLCQTLHAENLWLELKIGIFHLISEIIRRREPFMINHPYRVVQWSRLIGKKLLFDENRLYKLDTAAIMHDIGKLYIDLDILNKTSRLTEEEFKQIKQHPINSYTIIKDVFCFEDELKNVCQIVKFHHERYDGKGYPEGLKGEEIPLESRILCVADSVDAMMTSRSYKNPKSLEETIAELIAEKGKQFDPKIADIMIKILLKTKTTQENIFSDLIVWGTLTIDTKENSYIVEGTLEKHKIGYVFNSHSFNFSNNIEIEKVTKISLYIEKNRNVNEFDVKVVGIDNNNMYISQLVINPITDSFSMFWNLNGLLYKENKTHEINIYQIGGSFLSFYILDTNIERYIKGKILKLTIYFDEETEITVTGKIVKSVSVSKKNFYEFTYINTPDNVKDKIFRQLFRKQIDMMKLSTVQNF